MLDKTAHQEIAELTRRIRFDIIKMTYHAGSGHPGGSLSITDILAVLYSKHLRHKPENPDWENRDRVVLSKGHACPAFYAVLSELGYFPREELWKLRKLGAMLQGHPALLGGAPGTEVASGSLGQGLSIAVGMAIASKTLDNSDRRNYAILGDGEIQEGQIWEAFMAGGHHHLDNLVAIIDNNDLQIDGFVSDVMSVYPIVDKIRSFNWHVIECDGHDIEALDSAFSEANEFKGRPTAIIAKTVKGKGVSFMENEAGWHGKAPNRELAHRAVKDLGFPEKSLDEDI